METYQHTYVAAGGANEIIATGPAILKRVIFGADVGSSVVEISDSTSDGDGNIKFKFSSSTLMDDLGSVEIGTNFVNGITCDIVNQTDITFVWTPSGSTS